MERSRINFREHWRSSEQAILAADAKKNTIHQGTAWKQSKHNWLPTELFANIMVILLLNNQHSPEHIRQDTEFLISRQQREKGETQSNSTL